MICLMIVQLQCSQCECRNIYFNLLMKKIEYFNINMQYSVVIPILSLITVNAALRILVCFPMSSKSHSILGHGIVDRLLEAGHEVVHITSYPSGASILNLKEVNISSMANKFLKETEKSGVFKVKNVIGKGNIADYSGFVFFGYNFFKSLIEEPNVVTLLSDPKEKFDVVICEWFYSELNVGIAPLFKAPMIWVCSTEPHWQVLRLIDEVPNPAYSVDLFADYSSPLSFWQRIEQIWKITKKMFTIHFIIAPMENLAYNSIYTEIAKKRRVIMPSYKDAVYNGSLMFLNSHPSIGGAMKLPQNAINIAGYHIQNEVKPLPKTLQTIMNEAKNGVIYFSLGSYMLSDSMSEKMTQSFLNMFSKLDQLVLFKYESALDNVPVNVHLLKWAPQPSILAHPNLKLFITHGGQLSTTEAAHYGVPLVGIPILADQYINMISIERKGLGIKVKLTEDMANELEVAIKEVLTNETYKIRAKEVSSIFHDRPMKPGAALVYWVEHVVRTRGALHLRSPALSVAMYQKLYLDLLALIFIVVVLVYKTVKCALRIGNNLLQKSKIE